MLYVLTFVAFFFVIFFMIFAEDGYLNAELSAYERTIREPWIDRVIALRYRDPTPRDNEEQ